MTRTEQLVLQNLLMEAQGNKDTALLMAAREIALLRDGFSFGAARQGHLGYEAAKAIPAKSTPPRAFDVDHTETPNG